MGAARVVIVVLVFVASLAALALSGSTDELAARDQLRAAAAELAAASREQTAGLPDHAGGVLPEPDNRRLAEIVRQVLASYPGTEGGFYLTRSDQFAGAVKSGAEPPTALPPDDARKDADRKGDKKKDAKKEADKKAPAKKEPEPKESASAISSPAGRRWPFGWCSSRSPGRAGRCWRSRFSTGWHRACSRSPARPG